jgi:carboxyl-terminal processing protease
MQEMHKVCLLLALLATCYCFSQPTPLLTKEDIPKVMDQMAAQHFGTKEIDGALIKKSLKEYIDHFDPEKIYLLKREVEPFLSPSNKEIQQLGQEYHAGDFTPYQQLDQLFKKAIIRSREWREKEEQNSEALVEKAKTLPADLPASKEFAATEKELRDRGKNFLTFFLKEELDRFGEKNIIGHERQALHLYEKHIRSYEDRYLYLEPNNIPMSSAQKDNEFASRVIKALAKSLDPHSAFLDPQEADAMRSRLEKDFEGVGIAFQEAPQGIEIAQIVKGGPADKDGRLKPGDQLQSVNGLNAQEESLEEILKEIKEAAEKKIDFVFFRPVSGETLKVTLTRAPIRLNEGRVEAFFESYKEGILGVLTLNSFYQNDDGVVTSEKDIQSALNALRRQGNLKGLILDLRENSGGFLSQAVKVVGLFITNGVVVVAKYSDGNEKIYRDIDSRRAYNGPLIVLTSKITASAAEIVAEALQDYGVALIVGDSHTYGKGTIQSQNVTENKGIPSFKVTVGEYYTVSGKTPQLEGVKADIVVPGPYANMEIGESYLEEPVPEGDKIAPNFNDSLTDIDPQAKTWFSQYYLPSMQQQSFFWDKAIPDLKAQSAKRLQITAKVPLKLKKLDWAGKEEKAEPIKMEGDMQLPEAIAILEDMIDYQGVLRQKEYLKATPPALIPSPS